MTITDLIKEIQKSKDLGVIAHNEVISKMSASFGETKKPLKKQTLEALKSLNINHLFSHQAEGIDLVKKGKNLVVMTPTASGKSLIYNIPIIEELLKNPESKALYIFPLKSLAQDQKASFDELTSTIEGIDYPSDIYDGDTSQYRRKKIRNTPPSVVFTNPDMIHFGILPFHNKWEKFFKDLKFIVIDELHSYRGVVGSNVSHVIRRLRRIANHYGSDPQFITSSATIANPTELAQMMTGLDFELVSESGASESKKHFLFINPIPELSPYAVATKIFTETVTNNFKTIAFTKSRKITDLMHKWVTDNNPDLDDHISSYRSGFLPEERRQIEQSLFAGELKGVISTSALELGIDIGGLDVCILVGYPGTISSTWQRAGRVGRGSKESLVIMIALEDALDQYFMRHPKDFFASSVEASVTDPLNVPILEKHLPCAVRELPLKKDESVYNITDIQETLTVLDQEGKVRYWEKGQMYYPTKGTPHREVNLRGGGHSFDIIAKGKVIATTNSGRVMKELYPGAVYMHRGLTYKVTSLNLADNTVRVDEKHDLNYYTTPITEEESEILEVTEVKMVGNLEVSYGKLKITEQVLGYRKKELYTKKELGEVLLDLPPITFNSTGIWMAVGDSQLQEIDDKKFSIAGGLHALEHSLIATLPLFALCDRNDLGGRSYTMYPDFGSSAIFVYDGHEGGIGLSKRGFDVAFDWFTKTGKLMDECNCDVSCPSCTQDPHCGNNNDPLDKRAALLILESWL